MGSVSSVMPNFNPASVTNEICLRQNFNPNGRMFPLGLKLGSVSPQEVPQKKPRNLHFGLLAGVRCFQPKLERHLEIRHSVIVRKLFAFRLSQLTCLFRPDGDLLAIE